MKQIIKYKSREEWLQNRSKGIGASEALISVAHPDFRDELIAEAEKLHIWRRSNKR